MKRIAALLACLALASCATCREHKMDCAVATGMVVGVVLVNGMSRSPASRSHDIQTPRVNCVNAESCK